MEIGLGQFMRIYFDCYQGDERSGAKQKRFCEFFQRREPLAGGLP